MQPARLSMEPYFSLFIQTELTNLAYKCILMGATAPFKFIYRVTPQDGTACTSIGRR